VKKMAGVIIVSVLVWLVAADPGMAFWGEKKQTPPEKKQPVQPVVPAVAPAKPMAAPAAAPVAEKTPVKVESPVVTPAAAPIAEKTPVKVEPPVVTPAPAISEAAKEKMRELQRQNRAKLNNSQWDVDIMLMTGGGKPAVDKLVFRENKFSAEKYAALGFAASNYTLTVQEDSMTVWETMQTAEKGGTIFWRGEINGPMTEMRGVLSHQKADGSSEDFSFVSKNRQAVSLKESSQEMPKETPKEMPKEMPKETPKGKQK